MGSHGELSDIKTVERVGWIALAVGLVPPLILLAYAMIVWQQVGHFPSPGHPSLKDMGTPTVRSVVLLLLLLSPYCLIIADVSSSLFFFSRGCSDIRS